MAYPPQFSSTETYANRYDLDEIDVFLEGNSNNPMFFNVNGLPNRLSYGKHYFHLSTMDSINQQYKLRPNSKILFEFKSINNVVLRSDVVKINQKNGIVVCYVEVLQDPLRTMKEIEDGIGTLAVVGSIEEKENAVNPLPQKFKEAMNYRCIFPIDIRKNLIGADSSTITNVEHKQETIKGQFSFVRAGISPEKHSSVGQTYGSNGYPDNPYSTQDLGNGGGGSTS